MPESKAVFCPVICTSDIGSECSDIRPLDEARMRTLSVNSIHLVELVDSSDAFVTELASPTVGCITLRQRDQLVNTRPMRDRNYRLLELLSRRSVASFAQFTKVLAKYQAHVEPLLVTDGGETFLICHRLLFDTETMHN